MLVFCMPSGSRPFFFRFPVHSGQLISVVSASATATTESPSPQALRHAFEDKLIQKDALVEQVAFNFAQFGFVANVVPSVPDSADLPGDVILHCILAELEI